jgi:hypothetical protein
MLGPMLEANDAYPQTIPQIIWITNGLTASYSRRGGMAYV